MNDACSRVHRRSCSWSFRTLHYCSGHLLRFYFSNTWYCPNHTCLQCPSTTLSSRCLVRRHICRTNRLNRVDNFSDCSRHARLPYHRVVYHRRAFYRRACSFHTDLCTRVHILYSATSVAEEGNFPVRKSSGFLRYSSGQHVVSLYYRPCFFLCTKWGKRIDPVSPVKCDPSRRTHTSDWCEADAQNLCSPYPCGVDSESWSVGLGRRFCWPCLNVKRPKCLSLEHGPTTVGYL